MSEARTFKVKSSLARQMFEPGGRLVREADRLAQEGLDGHRADTMDLISTTLDELEGLCVEPPEDGGPRVYALASRVIDLAGFFDTGPLYEAAYSLCDVADRMTTAGDWRWPFIAVHVQALRLILTGGCRTGRTSETLLKGLRSVAARVAGTEEA